ncbi:hypothetical protein pqer_cds_281 [Pandoravirus quercus]|uniref:Uncharacterized protein n=1 Tax=Pandoravirus quercus TaxID=2107709 RepID=A0A2U7U8E7_9VIRU|nr:hypothetical protein pqer_cds_281 [Pandoravirus quercus]AVK74703.1 hypothetical protein pqer_cds_281 [Pandoravirus quercus]
MQRPMGAMARGEKRPLARGATADPGICDRNHDNHTEHTDAILDLLDPPLLGTHARSYFYRHALLRRRHRHRRATRPAVRTRKRKKSRRTGEREAGTAWQQRTAPTDKKSGACKYQRRPCFFFDKSDGAIGNRGCTHTQARTTSNDGDRYGCCYTCRSGGSRQITPAAQERWLDDDGSGKQKTQDARRAERAVDARGRCAGPT